MCEKDKIKVPTILENVAITERELGVKIGCHFMAVELFVKRCKEQFDYIFLDPPFPYKFRLDLLKTCEKRALVADGGTLLIHYPEEDPLPPAVGSLVCTDRREYGRSIVNFYTKTAPTA